MSLKACEAREIFEFFITKQPNQRGLYTPNSNIFVKCDWYPNQIFEKMRGLSQTESGKCYPSRPHIRIPNFPLSTPPQVSILIRFCTVTFILGSLLCDVIVRHPDFWNSLFSTPVYFIGEYMNRRTQQTYSCNDFSKKFEMRKLQTILSLQVIMSPETSLCISMVIWDLFSQMRDKSQNLISELLADSYSSDHKL